MALLDMNLEVGRITLRFDGEIPAPLLNSGEVYFILKNAEGKLSSYPVSAQYLQMREGMSWVLRVDPEPFLLLMIPASDDAHVGFLQDGSFVKLEQIRFASNLLLSIYDPLKLNCAHAHLPKKPGRVAIFTQSFNEGEMLLYWEKYYAQLVGYENLFVLNNGSTDDSCARLNPKTSVINMPAGLVDHANFAQLQGYFERFLLQKYEWVVKIDADEFIVCEGDIAETLQQTAGGIYAPEYAVAVIHDKDTEAQFSFADPLRPQRKHFVHEHPVMKKPSIMSLPVTWGSGNHKSAEKHQTLSGFWMVHLRWVDLNGLLNRNSRWAKMVQSERDALSYSGISSLVGQDMQALYDSTVEELRVMLQRENVALPQWLAAKL